MRKHFFRKHRKNLATLQCCLLDRTRFFESIQALVANIHSDHLVTSHPNSMSEQVYIYISISTYHASVTIAKQTISNVQHYVHYKKSCVNKSVNNTWTVRNPTHDPKRRALTLGSNLTRFASNQKFSIIQVLHHQPAESWPFGWQEALLRPKAKRWWKM